MKFSPTNQGNLELIVPNHERTMFAKKKGSLAAHRIYRAAEKEKFKLD
jgi:hypothetical protein